MTTLRLYAPVLVLFAMAILTALQVTITEAGLVALTVAVFVHIRAEKGEQG